MYRDLAEAVEDLKENGYSNLFEDKKLRKIIDSDQMPDFIGKLKIQGVYHFDEGTDPGDECTLYVLKLPDQRNGYIILSYGIYKDPEKADLIDELKKLEKKLT